MRRALVVCIALCIVGLAAALWFVRRASANHAMTISTVSGSYCVIRIPLDRLEIALYSRRVDGTPYRDFATLRADLLAKGLHPVAITNSGIFSSDLHSLGLHVEAGRELTPINLSAGEGNFFLKPNGVFFVDAGRANVVELSRYLTRRASPPPTLAIQSGPMLVIDGAIHPAFDVASTSRFIRSGIGVDRDGAVCLAISNEPVTFHAIASLFRDELHCPNALYLDGGISRMWVDRERDEDGGPFAGMIVVSKKE